MLQEEKRKAEMEERRRMKAEELEKERLQVEMLKEQKENQREQRKKGMKISYEQLILTYNV